MLRRPPERAVNISVRREGTKELIEHCASNGTEISIATLERRS